MQQIAIIGAGLAGVTLASTLSTAATVTIFEKSRGIGGRMSTRRASPFSFDHGAQYFDAKTAAFQTFLDPFIQSGTVADWSLQLNSQGAPFLQKSKKFVCVPSMNALCKKIAEGFNVVLSRRVAGLRRRGEKWDILNDADEVLGSYDWVVSTAPQPQTAEILPDIFSGHTLIAKARMTPSFSLMLGFEQPLPESFTAARVDEGPVIWIARNDSKQGRPKATSLVIQSDPEWAAHHVEEDRDKVITALTEAASAFLNIDLSCATHIDLHRWLYAQTSDPVGQDFLLDEDNRLAVCADWCRGSYVEDAFLSGHLLGKALSGYL